MVTLRASLPYLVLLFGAGGIVVLVPLALGGFEYITDFMISFGTRIVEGTPTFYMWQKIPIPVYLRIRLFNITNPKEIEEGAKPKLVEMGPYVYAETMEKFDITFNEDEDTVRYRQVRFYYFQPQLSHGTEDDLVTFINVAFVGVAKIAHDFTDTDYLLATLHDMLVDKGERLTRTHKVREILFDGFSVQNIVDLASSDLVKSAGDINIPERLMDGKMGILEGKNGSDEGWFVVKTGRGDSKDFGRVVSWNGQKMLDKWFGYECNTPRGTDGIIYQPFLTPKTRLEAFVPDVCRSLYFTYHGTVQHGIITTYRFGQPPELYETIENNPNNYCYCQFKNLTWCPPKGVISVATCFEGAPLVMSQPHFLDADQSVQNMVEGLSPDRDRHWGYLDLHPRTGVSIEVRQKVQFGIELYPWPAMATLADVQQAFIPILWAEEGGDIDNFTLNLLKVLDIAMKGWAIGKWFFLFFSLLITGAGVGLIMQQKKSSKVQLMENDSIKSDDD